MNIGQTTYGRQDFSKNPPLGLKPLGQYSLDGLCRIQLRKGRIVENEVVTRSLSRDLDGGPMLRVTF